MCDLQILLSEQIGILWNIIKIHIKRYKKYIMILIFSLTFRPGFFAILSILFVFWLVEPNIFKKTGPWPVINPYRKFNPNYDLEPGQSN